MATETLAGSASTISAKARAFYRPELDALRFFACLSVFLHHIGIARHLGTGWLRPVELSGAFGVCLFFLLSAYLITELLWKERDLTGSIHLRSFYARRVLRIWPLYFGCILLYLVLALLVPHVPVRPYMFLALTFMVGNWYFASAGWVNFAIDPMWSISVEEQFYLLVPTIARFWGKRAIWILSIFFLIASQIMLLWLGLRHVKPSPGAWTNSIVQVQFFAAGCILALVLQDRKSLWGCGWARGLAFFLGLTFWVIAAGTCHIVGGYAENPSAAGFCAGYGMVLVGTILLFLAVYGISARWIPKWLIYLGKISYGLYLFQGFAFALIEHRRAQPYIDRLRHHLPGADIMIEIGLTFCAAALSYRFFEKPFLRLKDRFAFVHSRPV